MSTAPLRPRGDVVATGRRYDPVEAKAIMATLYTAGALLAGAIDVLPTWPGVDRRVVLGLTQVNDMLCHHYGDALLVEVGARLHRLAGEEMACRLGGDEFAVLLPGADAEAARQQAETVARTLAEPYRVDDADIPLTATVGVATHTWAGGRRPADEDGTLRTLSALLAQADAAMYHARDLHTSVAGFGDGADLGADLGADVGAEGTRRGPGRRRRDLGNDHRAGAANL
jgi:diguanylate cyclase (GGDEF)-like protein